MFTIEQIKDAHAKVKTGADFPRYVQDIIQLGVTSYDTYVTDGHTDYYGKEGDKVSSDAKYNALEIALEINPSQFIQGLKEHQQGKTDYLTFCDLCARSGVEKWTVNMDKMACTYYDWVGKELLAEIIPVP